MATISTDTFVTNFNADGQAEGVELMTDERGHMYPISHLFQGSALGSELSISTSSSTGTYVTVNKGYIQIPFGDYAYLGWLDQDKDFRIDASTSEGARFVAVVAYIYRSIQYENSVTNNPGLLRIIEVDGAASNNPSEVTDSAIKAIVGDDNPYVVLAQIYLPANAQAVSASNILDKRTKISLREGVTLPRGAYASGLSPSSSSSYSNPMEIAVINANDTVPEGSADHDLLVCRLSL